MIEIELNNIKKNYGLKNILDGFNLEVKTGERVALVGPNGSGKSTVLKIISKQENIDDGTISIRNQAKIGILNQIYENEKDDISVREYLYKSFEDIFRLEEKMSVLENSMSIEQDAKKLEKILNEYGRLQEKYTLNGGYEVQEKFNKICTKFYISDKVLNQSYNLLSGGEKTKVNLARLLLKEPDILLLDEPTNHLDIDSLEFLEELILKYKGSILIVSHDRYFLDKVATKTVLLENGKANLYYGNYSYFLEEDERRTLAQFENYKNQQKQIEKMKESIAKLRKFGELAKNELFFKRAKSIEKRLEKMDVIEKVEIDKKSISLKFNMDIRSGKEVVKIEKLNKSFNNKIIFKDADMLLVYGEKAALLGSNGAGKSTLINMILGKDTEYIGLIRIGTSIKIGYIPQNITFDDDTQTVLRYYIHDSGLTETDARKRLARYGFRSEDVFKRIGKLSGGEKVRLILMKLMLKNINFLILDEPTNHIDIDTREILEEALKDYKGTVLFVSHDRYFINKLATRVFNIENNKINSYLGNYDDMKR